MRYLIAETSWTMMTVARKLGADGTLITGTDRPEDLAYYLRTGGVDAILLEAETLSLHGLSLATLRAIAPQVPVVLISAHTSRERVADWLQAGADTVIAADMDAGELAGRVLAVARRAHGFGATMLHFGPLCLDLARRRAQLDGAYLHLTPKVYELLEFLALRVGTLVTRDAMLSHVYGLEGEPDPRVFDVYMCTLRGHLRAAEGAIRIQTARGKGFRFMVLEDEVVAA